MSAYYFYNYNSSFYDEQNEKKKEYLNAIPMMIKCVNASLPLITYYYEYKNNKLWVFSNTEINESYKIAFINESYYIKEDECFRKAEVGFSETSQSLYIGGAVPLKSNCTTTPYEDTLFSIDVC